eukprot:TRINITY_DN9455_c0_g1_i1.p1 TRINITY_DN9455_c0_g1~~TRINITY_DN9455_c0_g1_i1.p1  ORF type:complete len:196 (+),score=36.59 TRINITY_DN9455_c0_g1_i1:61-648(+)
MTTHESEMFRREGMCKPGGLVYSAKMDQDALEKMYCCMFLCPIKKTLASRTYVDVYTNGLQTNIPVGCCCCCWLDCAKFLMWDDKRMGKMGKAGCCSPFPWLCPHACGCCGEAVYIHKSFALCLGALPTLMGHCYACCGCFPIGCCVTDVICGLRDGEAEKIAEHVEKARRGEAVPIAPHVPPMVQAMGVDQTPR